MIENILFFLDGALLLIFGINLSAAFAGIRLSKRNILIFLGLCGICGALQLGAYFVFSESAVRRLYPLITHLPLLLLLCLYYRKRLITALVSVFTAYLCCQPAKWVGLLFFTLSHSTALQYIVRILILVASAIFALKLFSPYLSEIFNKDNRSVCIFGSVPIVYYCFDYATVVYTNLWRNHAQLVGEFFPALLCIMFIVFCVIYYHTYEQKADAERKEYIGRIIAQQRAKELEVIRHNEKEIRMLRHDMRLLLNNIALCLENGDFPKAQEMVVAYSAHIDGTQLEHFCGNDTVNYVLSDFSARCRTRNIRFDCAVNLKELKVDEILFSSILSNALDNAMNAQEDIPADQRYIQLMLKCTEDKLLVSVKNPVAKKPVFADGLPVTDKTGHGFGTQSIRYMTERLGGNCLFSVHENYFLVRIVI